MKGKSVLTSQQIAHVLALHLAGRSLFIEELALLTGNVLPASDERWRELERLGLAERVSSPHGTAWKAGDETAAFIRSQLPLLKEFFRPDEKAYALTCLHEQASLSDCETVLSRISQCAERDRNILPLLELAVLFLLRWGRRNGSTAGLDGKFLNLVFAVQGLSFNSTELLKKILRLSALAYGLARKNGNKRFLALLMLSRMYLHVFIGSNTTRLTQNLQQALCRVRSYFDGDTQEALPLFEGLLAYLCGDLKKNIDWFNRCSEETPWYYKRFYDTLAVCTLFSAGYLQQFHFALGCIEFLRRTATLTDDILSATLYEVNTCFLLLRKRDSGKALEFINRLRVSPLYTQHTVVNSLTTRAHALYHFLAGDIERAYAVLNDETRRAITRDIRPATFKDPLVLDMLYVFAHNGYVPIPYYELEPTLGHLLLGANVHLKGSAMRVQALLLRDRGEGPQKQLELLRQSFELILTTRDMHELTLTAHELANTCELCGSMEEARSLRNIVCKATGKPLDASTSYHQASLACLNVPPAAFSLFTCSLPDAESEEKYIIERCHKALNTAPQREIFEERLHLLLRASIDGFRVERAAFFRTVDEDNPLQFVQAVNLSALELKSEHMRPCMQWLVQVAQQRSATTPVHFHKQYGFCLSIDIGTEPPWLLYLSSTYSVLPADEFSLFELRCAARLFTAELRSALFVRRLKERENELQQNKLRSIFLQEDRGECLVLGAGLNTLLNEAKYAAVTDVPILLWGETGVGKEIMARHIHRLSGRQGPFIAVHPASMVESLFESEFFGHERGAFTGASNQKIGLFEMADQGTLFIDEIGEMSPLIQTKLLRVLQEQRFMRVGGTAEIKSRFRLIAATNRDLWKEVREKRFRQDLLYRISVVPLLLPPLRERKQDILPLVDAFIRHSSQRYGKTIFPLSPEQKQALVDYSWPGNVRELKNIIERAVILCEQGASLHFHFDQANMEPLFSSQAGDGGILADTPTLEQLEERYLRKIMAMTQGRVRGEHGAAVLLHMKIPTLYAKLRKFSIPCGKR